MMGSYDYIIVGSGIAGLYAAHLARERGSVLVLEGRVVAW
jgi:L-aspartate oxidase